MSNICPYPGLRPFTEEESIFFKGRDLHIEQVTKQLEQKKFVMLTGASGDGKSSLIYAGVIPNARAGFFKAKYNNWLFATLRPERTPLDNLTKSISEQMNLNYEDVRKELGYGFSSLVNLYKNSSFYFNADSASSAISGSDKEELKKKKRKAANLFILIDQFEEFFTNPENYSQGVPSNDSQTVINLILETAKIALEQDLPIYIVCTMRSDYIGQCAAFRGLPEMIGFSQFFVPRLKRKEIYQVIEEPATLAGCKISQRLVENLINGMNEGFDQLPVLQHALNGLWNEANRGQDEMDLIHLAKITGLFPGLLPEADKTKFQEWNSQLPVFRKKHFSSFGLEKVLGTHADTLYETAHEYYNLRLSAKSAGNTLESENAQQIIKITFQCLTRIDASRAVRNRMTLQEITDIISPTPTLPIGEGVANAQGITTETVAAVLNIFREQGNTLISPFINENPASRILHPASVLDITHESLIRNWSRLREWANEENENYLTWQDFNKQLQRWVNSGKSSGYLLPIGPLNYFENWFNTTKPNKYWLARYDNSKISNEEKLKSAESALANAQQFIKKSARKLLVTRTVMHYGANKVAAFFAVLALITTCTYYYFDFRKKQNDAAVERIEDRGMEMLSSNKVKTKPKAAFVVNYERLHNGSFAKVLDALDNDTLAFEIAYEAFWLVQNFSPADRENDTLNPLAYPLLQYMNKRLQNLINLVLYNHKTINEPTHKRLNQFLRTCVYVKYYDDTKEISNLISQNLWRLNNFIRQTLDKPADSLQINAQQLLTSVELLLSLADNNKLYNLSSFAEKISPFKNENAKKRFEKIFPKEQTIKVDYENNLSHNGGYQMLAYLYAMDGDIEKINSCLDSVFLYNKDYNKNYSENFYDILAFLAKYNYFPTDKAEPLIMKFQKETGITYNKLFDKIKEMTLAQYREQTITEKQFTLSLIKYQLEKYSKDKIWDYYFEAVSKYHDEKDITLHFDTIYKDPITGKFVAAQTTGQTNIAKTDVKDALNFKYAMYYKKRGVYVAIAGSKKEETNFFFSKAFEYFALVSAHYRNKIFTIGGTEGTADAVSIKNSVLFLYPTIIAEDNIWNPYWFDTGNNGFLSFADYITDNELVYHYKSNEDFEAIEKFLYQYFAQVKVWSKHDTINYSCYDYTRQITAFNKMAEQNIAQNFIELVIINKAFEEKNITKAMNMYEKLNFEKILSPESQTQKYPKKEVNVYLLKNLAANLALQGKTEDAFKIIHSISTPYNRRNALIDIAEKIQINGPQENTFMFIDSLFKEIGTENKFGLKLLQVLGMAGSQPIFALSTEIIKDVNDKVKPRALINFVRGILYNDYYYKAFTSIPDYISSTNELELYNEILHKEIQNNFSDSGWKKFHKKSFGLDQWSDYENSFGGVVVSDEE